MSASRSELTGVARAFLSYLIRSIFVFGTLTRSSASLRPEALSRKLAAKQACAWHMVRVTS